MTNVSFLARMTFALTFGVLVPILLIGLAALWWAEQVLIDRALYQLHSVVDLQQARTETLIDRSLERFALVASRTQLRLSLQRFQREADPADRDKIQRIIADARRSIPAIASIAVLDLAGRVVATTPRSELGEAPPPVGHADLSLENGPAFSLSRESGGEIHARIGGALAIDGERIGQLLMRMKGDDLLRIVHNFAGLGDTGETLLARRDANGNALLLAPTRFDPAAGLRRRLDGTRADLPINRALNGHRGVFADTVDYRGAQVLSATAYLPETGWGIVAKIDRAEVLETFREARVTGIAVLTLTCAVVVALALALARAFRKPMRSLLEASARIGRGDLSSRIELPGRNEFSELGDAFNRMSASLLESSRRVETEIERGRRLEDRFRRIIESAPTAMVLCSDGGRIELVNLAAERLFGYGHDELVGQAIEVLLPERFAAAHPAHREAYCRLPTARSMGVGRDLAGRCKDGTEVPVEIGLNPIQTDEGTLVLSAIVDLTERRRFESHLLDQNQKLETEDWLKSGQMELANRMRRAACVQELAEQVLAFFCENLGASAGAFYIPDARGQLVLRAGRCLPSRGVPATVESGQGLVGQSARDREMRILSDVPPGHLPIESGFGASEPLCLAVVPLVSGDRTLGVLELATMQAFDDRHVELLSLTAESIAISVDVSLSAERLRELLDETQRKSKALEQASTYKSAFLANMSHELRTPLNSLLILARTLADNAEGRLCPEDQQSAAIIERSGQNLLALINDILDMSKIEAGKLAVALEEVDVRLLVGELMDRFEPLAATAGLELRSTIGDGVPDRIRTDPKRLGQILSNLVTNGLKFTHQGSVTLEVDSAPSEPGIAFAVVDTGVGIELGEQRDVFDAFYQVDSSRTRAHGGTGLGLSICRQLAGLLGGELTLRSVPGQGSTFTLRLPLREEPAAPGPLAATPAEDPHLAVRVGVPDPPPPSRERVLVLDEDMRRAYALVGRLAKSGVGAEIAGTIDRACALLGDDRRFDAVVLHASADPDGDAGRVRALRERIGSELPAPVVLIGEEAQRGPAPALAEQGVRAVVASEFTIDELRAALVLSERPGADAA